MTGLWSALVTPGLALPAAQPQIEFTTISAVPGLSRTVSTSATVLSGVTPHCASSSHIGRTASRSYKGCIRPPLPFLHSLDARAEQVETSIPARAAINKSLSNMAIAPTLRYFILWHCAIKGTTVRATIRHGNVDVFRELLPPQLLFTGLAAPRANASIHEALTAQRHSGGLHPVGEQQNQPFQLSFNPSLKVDFQGSRVTSDGGLLLVRELDERLGLSELIAEHLTDSRGKNMQLPMADLLRQSIYSRMAGYEDVNDAERLAQDPTFRLIGSEKIWEGGAALTSRLQSFETDLLAQEENLSGLAVINRELIARAEAIDSPQRVVLDMDSTEIPVYGQQENSAYNGHFESTCYHPLLLFNAEGDCLAAKLRPGNVHSAEDWEELLLPEIERQQELGKEVVFRAEAAFAKPEIYEALEARGVKYAIRVPANENLERDISELLTRPVGRPSHKPVVWYKGFLYQAASWKTARRVVAKVEFHFGELFPRIGFIVTNLAADNRVVVRFYNKRSTAEQWIKEGKQAVKMTLLSCHLFRSNEVRLWLSVLAYNLGNLWRRLVLPKKIENWSLTSLQQRLVKTGGRLIKHARYYWLLLAESHLTRRLFGGMLRRIAALPSPAG